LVDRRASPRRRFLAQLAALLGIVVLMLAVQHGSKFRDWRIPVTYYGDGLFHAVMVKQVLDEGWFPGPNRFLGAPFGSNSSDFPVSEGTTFVIVHALGLFADWPFITNALLLGGYLLVAAAAFWTLSRMGFEGPWPFVGALLFAWLPYHPLQTQHLFLAGYYAVPLGVWLAWTVWQAAGPTDYRSPVATIVCGLIAGASGIYYAFFSSYLVVVAILATLGSPYRWKSLRRGLVVLAIVAGTTLANVAPSIAYRIAHGPNDQLAVRAYSDSERYGLKLIQLVLPRPEHRIEAARQMNERYAKSSLVPINESVASSLGLVACVGFGFLLWSLVRRSRGESVIDDRLQCLSTFNIACLVLGTVGGLSAVFAFVISPQIRGYNRISVFIGFVSIAGALLLIERFISRTTSAKTTWVAALVVLAIGLYDQTSPTDIPVRNYFYPSDHAFVTQLESRLERGAMVYEMPYHRYPEGGDQVNLRNYAPALGYLNSRELRWSYGQVKGREGDRWMSALKRLPIARQIEVAAESGFRAIVVDRRGFQDRGKAVEAELAARLGPPILESPNSELAAYRVVPTGNRPPAYESLLPAS
jgi:phosphoglycerol transferase